MEQNIEERVQKARQASVIGGIAKFLYYISPLGYFFNYQQHKLCKDITYGVWKRS